MRGVGVALAATVAVLAGCLSGGGGVGRESTRIELEAAIANLDDPVFVTHAGDGKGLLFVVEQGGLVRAFNGTHEGPVFLDLSSTVGCCGERGLLGLAFHPAYATNGRFYVYYNDATGDIVIEEYRANAQWTGADLTTAREVLRQEHRRHSNHNGGMLAFGADGLLYAGLGDGGSAGDPDAHAQDLDSLLGKILRLEVGTTCSLLGYCIPSNNPFAGKPGRDEVWHYGLRNPWRFSFDASSGDLWIGDVGQGSLEEIDRAPAGQGGLNFGWSRYEGTRVYDAGRSADGAVGPAAVYGTTSPHCAVTGGYVYRGQAISGLQGAYLFGDYCSGTIWTLRADGADWVQRRALDTGLSISSFGEGPDGELFVVDHGGTVFRVAAG